MSGDKTFLRSAMALAMSMGLGVFLSAPLSAQEEEPVELETYTAEGEVEDDLGILPTEPVDSVFGFGKTLLETPRAVSSISEGMIEALNISDIDDLVVVSPGAFTQSFFGVAGALDVRGTAGEVYFRGMRRLDNPGNYPTPLGATDRIDIVRGPSTPIMGPSKIGGYINFVPISARAETGQFLTEPMGQVKVERGSWDKNIVTAKVGGPGSVGEKDFGYYGFVQTENSGSYYDNSATDQNIYQLSFNLDLNEKSRFEFGGMYHEFDGNQVAGWNRLSQDLIDNGTYVTGTAQPLDTDGDGLISHAEYGSADGCCEAFFFLPDLESITDADFPAGMALVNPGTATLEHSDVLVSPDDVLQNDALTLYFDYLYVGDSWNITNKLFYDAYENLNENAYGFSQFADTFVFEEKLIFEYSFETSSIAGGLQISPSYRYTDFRHGDDYFDEYFDRRDLTGPSTALDARLLATRVNETYSEYYVGDYTDIGLGVMGDFKFDFGLAVTLGARYDSIDMNSTTPAGFTGADEEVSASDSDSGTSWTVSLSYETPIGITPYVTSSQQMTMIAGQGADLTVDNVAEGTAIDDSNLEEVGIKGSFLDGRLYAAIANYKQDRTDFNAQSATTNESVETKGTEFELRYIVSDSLIVTAAYTDIEIVNLNTLEVGNRFTFLGAEDLPNVDPSVFYGGVVNGIIAGPATKAGVPETSYSLVAQYSFLEKWAITGSYFHADETPSGYTASVILPSYDLLNAGISYKEESWTLGLNLKNITDEKYYRSNFPNLFGSSVVLPELPFSWEVSLAYKF